MAHKRKINRVDDSTNNIFVSPDDLNNFPDWFLVRFKEPNNHNGKAYRVGMSVHCPIQLTEKQKEAVSVGLRALADNLDVFYK